MQSELRRMEIKWWTELAGRSRATRMQMTHIISTTPSSMPTDLPRTPLHRLSQWTAVLALIKDMEVISRRCAEHYELFFNGGLLPNHAVLNDLPQRTIKHVMDLPPSVRELEECNRTLRNHKSPGADGLPAELFKYGGESVLREIHKVISIFWETESVPKVW